MLNSNDLKNAKAKIQDSGLFSIEGSLIKHLKTGNTGSITIQGNKFVLNVASRDVDLGEKIDSIALEIIEKHLSIQRAFGN